MIFLRLVTIMAVSAALFAGCNSKTAGYAKFVDTVPAEIEKLIKDKHHDGLYAVGTARSADEMSAINKASMQARAEVARQFKVTLSALQRDYQEASGERSGGEYSQVMEIFTTLELRGSRIVKSMVTREKNGHYVAKVLVVVSAQEMKVLLDERFRAYTSVRASKAYRELSARAEQERKRDLQSEDFEN
jgi:hypothetical protein